MSELRTCKRSLQGGWGRGRCHQRRSLLGRGSLGRGLRGRGRGRGLRGWGLRGWGSLGRGSLGRGLRDRGSLGRGSLGRGSLGRGSLGRGSLGRGSLGRDSLGRDSLGQGLRDRGRGRRNALPRALLPELLSLPRPLRCTNQPARSLRVSRSRSLLLKAGCRNIPSSDPGTALFSKPAPTRQFLSGTLLAATTPRNTYVLQPLLQLNTPQVGRSVSASRWLSHRNKLNAAHQAIRTSFGLWCEQSGSQVGRSVSASCCLFESFFLSATSREPRTLA